MRRVKEGEVRAAGLEGGGVDMKKTSSSLPAWKMSSQPIRLL